MAFLYSNTKLGNSLLYGDVSYTPIVVTPPIDPGGGTNPPPSPYATPGGPMPPPGTPAVVLPPVPTPAPQVPQINLPLPSPNTTADAGDDGPSWVVLCAVCAKRIRANTARKRWDGLIVCEEDWEPRHSLDMIRSRKPRHKQAVVPKEPAYQFVEIGCPYPRQLARADIGTSDCAIADADNSIDHTSESLFVDGLLRHIEGI